MGGQGDPDPEKVRAWCAFLAGLQGIALLALGVAGIALNTGPPVPQLLGMQLNMPHSVLLAVTGAGATTLLAWRRPLRWFLTAEFLVYLMLFVYGSAVEAGTTRRSWLDTDTAGNFLHAGLSTFSVALLLLIFLTPGAESRRT
ncbi:DUF4383 domain-containing protein [Saccharopolyspora taberi]|uniref:DUF4383 domain-containing protein n=1 Tax=Saccharopolyspora taberi TaxID=60895 RepID=A0ABN3VER6_9PSEU